MYRLRTAEPRAVPRASAGRNGKEINIRSFDQLRRLHAEPRHDLQGFARPGFGRLALFEHDL